MLKVGITGGIGSGKSVICRVFATLGIPVFNADDAARYLMEHDTAVMQSVKQLFGNDIYAGNIPDRKKIAAIVFSAPDKLQQLNGIMHPATLRYAHEWLQHQSAPYCIKEAAIFFESGSHKDMDIMVGVSAPSQLRIGRAMKRNNTPREKVMSIMAQQMDEDEKMKRCNHVIINDDMQAVLPQVLRLHQLFLTT